MAVLEPAGEELAPILWRQLLAPLVQVAGFVVAAGLIYLVDAFVRAMFGTANGLIAWIPYLDRVVSAPMHAVEHKLTAALGSAEAGIDKKIGTSLHAVAKLADQLADTQTSVAVNLWHMAGKIATFWGNATTGHLIHKASAKAGHAQATASSAVNTATHAQQIAHAAAPAAVVPKVGRLEGEYEHLADTVIPNLRARTKTVENSLSKAWHAIRSNEKLLVGTAFAGAVAVALGRLGLGWLRCNSLGKIGNRIGCGGWKLLDDLLAGVIDVLVIADLCQLTKLLIDVAESSEVQGVISGIVTGIDDLLLCQGVSRPPELAGYWTAPPPAQAFAALPAV